MSGVLWGTFGSLGDVYREDPSVVNTSPGPWFSTFTVEHRDRDCRVGRPLVDTEGHRYLPSVLSSGVIALPRIVTANLAPGTGAPTS